MQETLLDKVADGQRTAVQACIQRYGNLVWSLAKRFLSDQSDAEDAVQEIFIDLWKHASRFDPSVASESTFIATVARRRLIDRLRRRSRVPEHWGITADLPSGQQSAEERLEATEEAARIRSCMSRLKPEERQVLELAILQGRSQSQIAEILGLPLGTVKSHARRGIKRLRELSGQAATEATS